MFVLDTNILSAMMRHDWVPELAGWIATQPEELLFTAAVCQGEILAGIEVLPNGHRRRELEHAARAMFEDDFNGRILPFDSASAAAYADILAVRKRSGRPIAPLDLMIAATARAHNATMVTRDTGGFEGCGLALVNPWQSS
jgi:predicted nucleic acid-binding protein